MKRAWAIAIVAGAGAAALCGSAFALLAPPDLLDAAVALGDNRLWLALLGAAAVFSLAARVALIKRRSAEEEVVEPAPAPSGGSHLR